MKLVFVDDGLCLATWRNVFVNLWGGDVTSARLLRVRDAEALFAASIPGGRFFLLTMIRRPGKMMTIDSATREVAEQVARDTAPYIRAHAQVILGTGFWVATARAFMAAVSLMLRNPFPLKVCDDMTSGAQFLSEQMAAQHDPASRDELLTFAAEVQQAFDAQGVPPASASV